MTFYESHEGSSRSSYIPGRDDAVDEVMREWEHRYCEYKDVTIFISTFNVNGKPPPLCIPKWLDRSFTKKLPDFYVIGLQEMDLSTQAFLYDVSSRQDDWLKAIKSSLPTPDNYEMVETVRLVGIMLVIYRHTKSRVSVPRSSVHSAKLPTGVQLISRMGNKGGVAVSMQMNDSYVCFVNAHMAAGNEELDKRNQDYREISQIKFPVTNKSIFNHDVIFWLGDLNYRLEVQNGLSNEAIRSLCSSEKSFKDMIVYDTLKQQQVLKQVFVGFNEPEICFRPSYKYDTGTSDWDSSEKCRCPAWCDRILWYTEASDQIVQMLYDSVDEIKLSDHKPVIAAFQLTIRKIDQTKVKKVHDEATREADRRVNDALPQVQLSATEIDFGDVYYFESSVRTVTIKNIGMTKVSFSFSEHPPPKYLNESWLSITPPNSHVKVGSTCLLSLQVLVDKEVAWSVDSDGHLSKILVLHLDNGRDYFLSISANYKASVFGSSFVDLIRREEANLKQKCFPDLLSMEADYAEAELHQNKYLVPYAMHALVSNLKRNGLEKIRFDDVSRHSEFIALRKALDHGTPKNLFEVCKSPFNMFNAFLRLLDSFKEPIIPWAMQNECMKAGMTAFDCWQCVTQFPEENRNVLECYVEFVRELIRKNTDAKSQLETMANIAFKRRKTNSDKANLDKRLDEVRVKFFETLVENDKEDSLGLRKNVSQDDLINFEA
uniref:IPPc domain-containing protein n=1 Tax=Syphacia muris TaxID=451379 RepID=A0A0N5AB20_9BILA